EPVAARGQTLDELGEHPPKPREALEGPQLEELVEDEGGRLAGAGLRARQERKRRVERLSRAGRNLIAHWEGRRARHRSEKPFGGGRGALDVDVLGRAASDSIANQLDDGRFAGAGAADEHGNPRRDGVEGREHAAGQSRTRGQHGRPSRIGKRRPARSAVAIASGYPASACRATPIPGSHVTTRSSFSSASDEPSATITIPA